VNAPLRRVAIAVFILFGFLFANLNYVQFVQSAALSSDPHNKRVTISSYERERGAIVVDGQPIAYSKETDDRLKYQRIYTDGDLYAGITGYQSTRYGLSGIELAENDMLSGEDKRLFAGRLSDLLTGRTSRGGNVVLTLDSKVQKAAFDALGNRKGSIVALDPSTGAILAAVSSPSYDPNPLASHRDTDQTKAWSSLSRDPNKPMLNRAFRETFPPGSTFKIVTAAALLKKGYTPDSILEAPNQYTPPQTTKYIQNYHGEICGNGKTSSLMNAFTVSCNTPFAKLGTEEVGGEALREEAKAFGFEDDDLKTPLSVAESFVGPLADPPSVAQSSIGQRDVRMTPLQGAMLAAAVANNGTLMCPYLVKEVQAPDYKTLERTQPESLSQPLNTDQAGMLQNLMMSVVENGTGKKAQVSGVQVGGKTGTAEDGDERQDHDWFVGFAMKDGKPLVAVAVVLENAGISSATAAKMAGAVIRTAVAGKG
jgi:peptidoglycan glycosyltransferase